MAYSGVNAHHQNGLAEVKIRWLQELVRTTLAHAAQKWPGAVTANLWPYALRTANNALNNAPNMSDKYRRSPDPLVPT